MAYAAGVAAWALFTAGRVLALQRRHALTRFPWTRRTRAENPAGFSGCAGTTARFLGPKPDNRTLPIRKVSVVGVQNAPVLARGRALLTTTASVREGVGRFRWFRRFVPYVRRS
jgi:hypothetical protein